MEDDAANDDEFHVDANQVAETDKVEEFRWDRDTKIYSKLVNHHL